MSLGGKGDDRHPSAGSSSKPPRDSGYADHFIQRKQCRGEWDAI